MMSRLSMWVAVAFFVSVNRASCAEMSVSASVVFRGMCDASAAVALDDTHFAVASDEDSVLRIYQTDRPGLPVQRFDLSGFLELDKTKPETDLEGAARIGERIYWITSHSRNRNGKRRSSRERFFATEIARGTNGVRLAPIGRPYKSLLHDLVSDPRLKPFDLAAAARRAPKEPNAFNIEGLCARPDATLFIGFRNPIPGGKALLVPLLNPAAMITGGTANLGDPVLLDLGGQGIREIAQWNGRYLIVAGPIKEQGESRVFEWAGGTTVPRLFADAHLKDFNAEAIVFYPARGWSEIQILSDDGTRSIGEKKGKELNDPVQQTFRSSWLRNTEDP